MNNERMKELLISALEWSLECSRQIAHDIVRSMHITSDELEALGYSECEFPDLHSAVKE